MLILISRATTEKSEKNIFFKETRELNVHYKILI